MVRFFIALPHHDATITSGLRSMTTRGIDDAILAERLVAQLREDRIAAGDLDQLLDPADAGDERRVPFLEEDPRGRALGEARTRRARADRVEPGLHPRRERVPGVGPPDQRADDPDHLEDLGDAALVEGVDGIAAADQLARDVGLQIGERQHEIRLQRVDLVEAGVDEGRDLRLLPRLGRARGVARHADDPVPLAEQVERLGRLLRQADDAGWVS